jgi:hypothetical protein
MSASAPPQAHLHALAQVLGTPDRVPFARAGAGEPALGRDRDALVRVERLAQQILGDERPVGIGCVEQVDAELDRAAQHRYRGGSVARLAPHTGAWQLHRAVAESVYGQLAAEREGAAGLDGGSGGRHGSSFHWSG